MKVLKSIGLLFLAMFLVCSMMATSRKTCLYFFYGNGCQHCANIEPFIKKWEEQTAYPLQVQRFEIYANRSNMVLLNKLFDTYSVADKERGVPAVFIGDRYLIGDSVIEKELLSVLKNVSGSACPTLDVKKKEENKLVSSEKKLSTLSWLTIIGAALVDSINPCAIAVLLVLLSALMLAGGRRRALKAGLAFTLSIYISYFLFGLGLFSALQISGLSYWFYKIIGFLAILIGLANIKDFFWYGGGGFVMEIPPRWRPTLRKMLSSVTSPLGAFLLGFVVCLFELPCTGGPYLVILGLLAERTTLAASIPLLLIYNIFFVLPLLIITGLIYFGFSSVERATDWKDEQVEKLHLITGLVMLILGMLIVLGYV